MNRAFHRDTPVCTSNLRPGGGWRFRLSPKSSAIWPRIGTSVDSDKAVNAARFQEYPGCGRPIDYVRGGAERDKPGKMYRAQGNLPTDPHNAQRQRDERGPHHDSVSYHCNGLWQSCSQRPIHFSKSAQNRTLPRYARTLPLLQKGCQNAPRVSAVQPATAMTRT